MHRTEPSAMVRSRDLFVSPTKYFAGVPALASIEDPRG
jgi:hypothetical protein